MKRTCKAHKSVQHVQKVRSYTLCTCVSRVLQKKEKRTARVDFATDAVAKAIDLFGFATKLSISYASRNDVDIFGFRFALTRNRNKGWTFRLLCRKYKRRETISRTTYFRSASVNELFSAYNLRWPKKISIVRYSSDGRKISPSQCFKPLWKPLSRTASTFRSFW